MICVTCGIYFTKDIWSDVKECDRCVDNQQYSVYNTTCSVNASSIYSYQSSEDKVDIEVLLNPTGKTQGVFYD